MFGTSLKRVLSGGWVAHPHTQTGTGDHVQMCRIAGRFPPWPPSASEVTASDGRRLEGVVDGTEGGPLVVMHHERPARGSGSGRSTSTVRASAGCGSRSIRGRERAPPERRPGRTVSCVADAAAVAIAAGAERFYTVGGSGGGPHALACAALLPDRVIAAATIAGVAPYDAAGLDWLEGMGEENLEEFAAADAGPAELGAFISKWAGNLREIRGDECSSRSATSSRRPTPRS